MNSKYKTQSGYAKRTASTNTIKAMENGTNPNDFFYRFWKISGISTSVREMQPKINSKS